MRPKQPRKLPLAYSLTFRTYGSWMRGDSRGWVDRDHNQVGSNYRSPRPPLLESDRKRMAEPSFSLSRKSRKLAAEACSRTCQDRSWILVALHVRTSHLHAIVRAATTPGRVLAVLKSCATKRLRAHGPYRTRYWARGGSKKYLWNPRQISVAIDYVLNCQGEAMEVVSLPQQELAGFIARWERGAR